MKFTKEEEKAAKYVLIDYDFSCITDLKISAAPLVYLSYLLDSADETGIVMNPIIDKRPMTVLLRNGIVVQEAGHNFDDVYNIPMYKEFVN